MPFGTQTTHQIVKDIKGLSGHGKAILQLYKVLTKLGILNCRFFKDRNIGKFACDEGKRSFVKLQNIKEASIRQVKFHSDQNKMSMKKKENSMPWYNNEYKEAKKVNEKSKGTIYLCTQLFDTLVTPISEYDIELWSFKANKGLKKLEKTNTHVHLHKFILRVKQSTAENFVYGELRRRPC